MNSLHAEPPNGVQNPADGTALSKGSAEQASNIHSVALISIVRLRVKDFNAKIGSDLGLTRLRATA